jgi:hypothetical protein
MDAALPAPAEATVATDGTFVVAAVQPGFYSVNVTGLPEDLYVRAASFAGVNALEKPLSVAYRGAQDPVGLTLQIASDGGRITGAVFDQTSMGFPAAQITLIPEGDARPSVERYRTAISGRDGSFTIRGIAPGDYRLFGWDNLEPNAYLNVDFMKFYQDFGTPIHIGPGQSGSVSLRLIQLDR